MSMTSGVWDGPVQEQKQGQAYLAHLGLMGSKTTEYLRKLQKVCYILANSNVEISSHLVDIQMTVYPAGMKGGRDVVPLEK